MIGLDKVNKLLWEFRAGRPYLIGKSDMVRLVAGGAGIASLVRFEAEARRKTIWQFLNERTEQNLFIFANEERHKIVRNVFLEFEVTVVGEFAREIVRDVFDASQQCFDLTVDNCHSGKQRDVWEGVMCRVEPNLSAAKIS